MQKSSPWLPKVWFYCSKSSLNCAIQEWRQQLSPSKIFAWLDTMSLNTFLLFYFHFPAQFQNWSLFFQQAQGIEEFGCRCNNQFSPLKMQGWKSIHLEFQHFIFTERLFLSKTLMRRSLYRKKIGIHRWQRNCRRVSPFSEGILTPASCFSRLLLSQVAPIALAGALSPGGTGRAICTGESAAAGPWELKTSNWSFNWSSIMRL